MRDIDTRWTTAQQKRLPLFSKCEEYGLQIESQSIAPFSFVVNENGEIRLIMDKIHIGAFDKNGTLSVRDDFPEAYDRYVIRATNALRDITDETGRLDRAAKRQEREEKERVNHLLIPAANNNARNIIQKEKTTNIGAEQIRRGLFGLASLGEISVNNIDESKISFFVNGNYDNALVAVFFNKDKVEACCYREQYEIGPDFENHLIRGAKYWSKQIDETAIKKILSDKNNDNLLDIDYFTLQQTGNFSGIDIEYEKCGLTIRMNSDNISYARLYHNGIFINAISYHHVFFAPDRNANYGGPLIQGSPLSDEEIQNMKKIIVNGYVEAMGINPKDMEKFSEAHLSKKIEDTDMGYYA